MPASPTTITIPQGGSGIVTVSTVLASGASQTVAMTITSPQIPGVTFTFLPALIPVGQPTSLNIGVADAATGTYTVSVTATGDITAHTVTFTLIIVASDFTI